MIEKKERNIAIYTKNKKGKSYQALAVEYNLSYNAIMQICQRYKSKRTQAIQ